MKKVIFAVIVLVPVISFIVTQKGEVDARLVNNSDIFSSIFGSNSITEDDYTATMQRLYQNCAPEIDVGKEGELNGFVAQILENGILYKTQLKYQEVDNEKYLEIVSVTRDPIQSLSCALTFEENITFIQLVRIKGREYWLDLIYNAKTLRFYIIDSQPPP
jgi:hypothetical protein